MLSLILMCLSDYGSSEEASWRYTGIGKEGTCGSLQGDNFSALSVVAKPLWKYEVSPYAI